MFGTWAMRGLGGLLILAAGLKLYGMAVEPVGRAGIFSEPWVQTLIIEWEIALGVWLLSRANRGLAWLVATATFLAFAGFSLWQGWIGQTSCGCFGVIRVDPWAALTIDVFALSLLALSFKPTFSTETPQQVRKALRPVAIGACGILVLLAAFAAIGTLVFGSPAAALVHLRGQVITVDPKMVRLPDGNLGESSTVAVQVRNWSDHRIRILGSRFDCTCEVIGKLPALVEPGETYTLLVVITFKGDPGQFTRLVRLYTDDDDSPTIGFRLTGRVFASTPSEASRFD
jgi:hypothetical protein